MVVRMKEQERWAIDRVRSVWRTMKNAEEEYVQELDEYERMYGHTARKILEEELVSR